MYCGFRINAGTRHEQAGEEGLAHFCEHMSFKGTTRRKAYHIIQKLECVGGDLNAFTNKREHGLPHCRTKKNTRPEQ